MAIVIFPWAVSLRGLGAAGLVRLSSLSAYQPGLRICLKKKMLIWK